MAVPLEQFVKHLEDSGILAGETLKDFLPPRGEPKDAEGLARELVRQKKLTKFQAEEVYRGKGKSLVLDNYVLLEKIGEGGMGQVFKAEHRRMHRIVAVKVLPTSMMKNAATVARFQREVQAAARINHPNIVTAFDAGQDGGVHFLVMEYVEGSDLSAMVKRNGPFPVGQAVNFILQVARGLEAAHKIGIVHRDIKPANLLVNKEGTVKILDMGLARLSADRESGKQADLTNTGTIMGTVDYISPEQALDTKSADARADIYSLGCSLFYLLTSRAAYLGDSMMEKLLAHRVQPIPSIRAIRPEVSEQVEVIFGKMIAKNVEDRYQTMSDVIADLERCSMRQAATVDTKQLFGSTTNDELADFLKDISLSEGELAQRKKSDGPSSGKNKKPLLLIGSGILGVMILLAGLVISLRTQDGTLIVKVNEADAEVQVSDEEGKVEITRKGEKEPITFSVSPGAHQLKVEKDGFDIFSKKFEIESRGKMSITANLVPLEEHSELAATNEPSQSWTSPQFQKWMKQVANLSTGKRVEAVAKKLQELNPGFDGREAHKIDFIDVNDLLFITDNVTDISPVRALAELKKLRCNGSGNGKGKVADLSPLNGMRLLDLEFTHTQVVDLSPLKGLPLTRLACGDTKVSDLSPLKDMKLTTVICGGTGVSDLSPLALK